MEGTEHKILIADNQELTYAGLLAFLAGLSDYRIVGHVQKSSDLDRMIVEHRPDLLIVDYNLPSYITLDDLARVHTINPDLNTLIISADNNKNSILKALQLGIKGYLTKACGKDEVLLAIQTTAKGSKFFCHKIVEILMEEHFSSGTERPETNVLTEREREILKLIAQGRSTQQIADSLHLSPHTVQTHRKSIIRKLKIKSPTEFVIHAMDLGLLKPSNSSASTLR